MRDQLTLRTSLVGCCVLLLCLPGGHAAGWETITTEPVCTPRHEAAMTALNGRLYLLGGRGVKAVEEYDPASKGWRQLSKTPMQLHHFQALVSRRPHCLGWRDDGWFSQRAVRRESLVV